MFYNLQGRYAQMISKKLLIPCYLEGGVGAVMPGCRRRVGAKIADNKKELVLPR
jgi:hypothetical protein